MVTDFDIVILGGGLNGAALACALANGPHAVAVVEPHPPAAPTEAWDSRIYAYSPGNVGWIKALGGWDESVRAQAVFQMRIHGDAGGRLSFDALDAGLPELAWIAENKSSPGQPVASLPGIGQRDDHRSPGGSRDLESGRPSPPASGRW